MKLYGCFLKLINDFRLTFVSWRSSLRAELVYIKSSYSKHCSLDDPKIFQLMSIWGLEAQQRWPIGVVWFATYLVFLGTSYGTKKTYRSNINAFNIIFSLLGIESPFNQ